MAKSARVLAIEDVDTLAAALVRFAEEAQAALADLDLELRRASQWIEQDRPRYWEAEVRRGWEAVARARRELEQARLIHRIEEAPSSCIDQKKALQRAQKRLDLAMEKQRLVRQWAYRTAKQTEEYRGQVGPLAEWLGAEYPRALAALRRMARALESYVGQEAVPTPKSLLEAVQGLVSAGRGTTEPSSTAPEAATSPGPGQADSETPPAQTGRSAPEPAAAPGNSRTDGSADPDKTAPFSIQLITSNKTPGSADPDRPTAPAQPTENPPLSEGGGEPGAPP